MALTDADLNKIKTLVTDSISKAFVNFWDKVLEPKFNEIENRFDGIDKKFDGVDSRFDNLENKVDDLSLEVKANGRKLDAEVGYRDRLEKRVQTLEKSN